MKILIWFSLIIAVVLGGYMFCPANAESRHSPWMKPAELIRHDYVAINVTTGAWVELDASMMTGIKTQIASEVKWVQIFDSSGQTLELGVGASGSESRILIIEPGGNGFIPIFIGTGQRLSVRAISANAVVGELIINTYYESR